MNNGERSVGTFLVCSKHVHVKHVLLQLVGFLTARDPGACREV